MPFLLTVQSCPVISLERVVGLVHEVVPINLLVSEELFLLIFEVFFSVLIGHSRLFDLLELFLEMPFVNIWFSPVIIALVVIVISLVVIVWWGLIVTVSSTSIGVIIIAVSAVSITTGAIAVIAGIVIAAIETIAIVTIRFLLLLFLPDISLDLLLDWD